jgi:hypothetical protein
MMQRYGFRIVTTLAAILAGALLASVIARESVSVFGPIVSALHRVLS